MPQAADFLNLKFSFRWSARKQSPEECAVTALAFLKLVQAAAPGFKKWTQVNHDDHKAVSLTKPSLTKLFSQGQILSEVSETPIERAGYKVFLSSSEKTLGFLGAYLHFGGYGRDHVNLAVLEAYVSAKKARTLFNLPKSRKFVEQAVPILEPDEGVLDNFELFKATQTPSTGWIIYLSNRLAERLPKKLPRGIELKPVKKSGLLLVAADKSFPNVPPTNLKALQSLGKMVAPIVKAGN